MKAAIYILTISKNEDIGKNLSRCIDICKQRGLDYDTFIEQLDSIRGSRSELDRILQRVRKKEYDLLIVPRLSYLGKNLYHLHQVVSEMRKQNMEILITSIMISTKGSQGNLLLNILDDLSSTEREFIKERIKASIATKRLTGSIGRPKGAKDKHPRRKEGYLKRWENLRKSEDTDGAQTML